MFSNTMSEMAEMLVDENRMSCNDDIYQVVDIYQELKNYVENRSYGNRDRVRQGIIRCNQMHINQELASIYWKSHRDSSAKISIPDFLRLYHKVCVDRLEKLGKELSNMNQDDGDYEILRKIMSFLAEQASISRRRQSAYEIKDIIINEYYNNKDYKYMMENL